MAVDSILDLLVLMVFLQLRMAGSLRKTRSSKIDNKKLVKEWKEYLSQSRLSDKDVVKRAKEFTRKGMRPNGS